jgi:hypothetical protein
VAHEAVLARAVGITVEARTGMTSLDAPDFSLGLDHARRFETTEVCTLAAVAVAEETIDARLDLAHEEVHQYPLLP